MGKKIIFVVLIIAGNEVQGIVNKYHPNESITVYYDPENPEMAVLEPGKTKGIHIPFIMGGGALLIGFLGIISKKQKQ